ncbi:MAG: hypothetical protein P8Y53_05775 [Pseudolabrys sp.]
MIALLGVLRAGMIAAPLLWRQQDMVATLRDVGAKAIVTGGAELARQRHARRGRAVSRAPCLRLR